MPCISRTGYALYVLPNCSDLSCHFYSSFLKLAELGAGDFPTTLLLPFSRDEDNIILHEGCDGVGQASMKWLRSRRGQEVIDARKSYLLRFSTRLKEAMALVKRLEEKSGRKMGPPKVAPNLRGKTAASKAVEIADDAEDEEEDLEDEEEDGFTQVSRKRKF